MIGVVWQPTLVPTGIQSRELGSAALLLARAVRQEAPREAGDVIGERKDHRRREAGE